MRRVAGHRRSDQKHQLVGGEVFALTGGTSEHARLIARVARLLVAQHEPRIERSRRASGGLWQLDEAGPGEHVHIDVLGRDLAVDAVYGGVLPGATG